MLLLLLLMRMMMIRPSETSLISGRHSRRVVTSVGSGILPTRYEVTFSLSGRREGALREKQPSSALLDG